MTIEIERRAQTDHRGYPTGYTLEIRGPHGRRVSLPFATLAEAERAEGAALQARRDGASFEGTVSAARTQQRAGPEPIGGR